MRFTLPDLAAPTIFTEWFTIFKNMTYADEFMELNHTVAGFTFDEYYLNSILGLIRDSVLEAMVLFDPDSHWFDDVFTNGVIENATTIIRNSFEKAIEVLKVKYGEDMGQWTFSNRHKLQIRHPFLGMFDYPEWSAWGWTDCVNNIFSTGDDGPAWREILNFEDLNRSLSVTAGGQSGSPFSRHYYDQLGMWLDGEYRPMILPATRWGIEDVEGVLEFVPR